MEAFKKRTLEILSEQPFDLNAIENFARRSFLNIFSKIVEESRLTQIMDDFGELSLDERIDALGQLIQEQETRGESSLANRLQKIQEQQRLQRRDHYDEGYSEGGYSDSPRGGFYEDNW